MRYSQIDLLRGELYRKIEAEYLELLLKPLNPIWRQALDKPRNDPDHISDMI